LGRGGTRTTRGKQRDRRCRTSCQLYSANKGGTNGNGRRPRPSSKLDDSFPPSPLHPEASLTRTVPCEMLSPRLELYALPGSTTHDLPTLDPESLVAASYLQLLVPGQWTLVECSDPSQSPSGKPTHPFNPAFAHLSSSNRLLSFPQAWRRDLYWLSHPQPPPASERLRDGVQGREERRCSRFPVSSRQADPPSRPPLALLGTFAASVFQSIVTDHSPRS
jgi:hypothetical protein